MGVGGKDLVSGQEVRVEGSVALQRRNATRLSECGRCGQGGLRTDVLVSDTGTEAVN